MRTNTKTIKITGYPLDWDGSIGSPIGEEAKAKRLEITLEKLCYLRIARKIGDTETVNHMQLGRLRDQQIQFEIL